MNPFEHMQLPLGWTTAAVGSVGNVRYGLGQPPELDDNGVAMIRATNIKRGRISSIGLIRIKRSAIPESRNAFLKEGDVLVVRSGAYTGDVAMVTKPWVDSVAGYDLVLSLDDNVDPSYCAFALRSAEVQNYFKSQSARSAQPHLNRQQLDSTFIPVPPLPEQRKIAGVLGLVQRAVEQQERLIALTTELKKALLHQLFTQGLRGEPQKQTEIGPVPRSWEVVTIGDLFKFRSGKSRPEDTEQTASESRPFPVFGGNGVLGFSSRYLFEEPLLLIGRVGEYCGCAHHTPGRAWVSDNALYAKEILRETNTHYAVEYFNYANLNQYRNQAGQPLITQGVISQVKMPLPPIDQQREILEPLTLLNQKLSVSKRKHAALTALFRTLLHQLMTAQLRVNNLDIDTSEVEK